MNPQKAAEPVKEKTIDQIYEYLLKYGEKTPTQLAKALHLDLTTVKDSLKKLERKGKIRLERPLSLSPTPPRVVSPRVPEKIERKVKERVERARAMQLKAHERQEEIRKKHRQLR